MKTQPTTSVVSRVVPILLLILALALPALAQENRGAASAPSAGGDRAGGPAVGGGGGGNAGGGGGGGSVSGGGGGGGGSASGGASGYAGGGSSGGRVDVSGRHAATGGSGVAVSRGDRGDRGERGDRGDRGANGGGRRGDGGSATAGGSGAAGTPVERPGGAAVGRREGGPRDARTPDGGPAGVPPHARPRGDEPITGTAVPRGAAPVPGGGSTGVIGTSFYPWWFGGVGYYGGYYGGYYDPWFGGYPSYGGYESYDPVIYGGSSRFQDEGSLRLKLKPREAEVYVDGYYVGIVDDFDGIFQKLHVETGPHRIEVRAPGYETLTFDVRIDADRSTTYRGELKKLQ